MQRAAPWGREATVPFETYAACFSLSLNKAGANQAPALWNHIPQTY
jgi:hypothetical protein